MCVTFLLATNGAMSIENRPRVFRCHSMPRGRSIGPAVCQRIHNLRHSTMPKLDMAFQPPWQHIRHCKSHPRSLSMRIPSQGCQLGLRLAREMIDHPIQPRTKSTLQLRPSSHPTQPMVHGPRTKSALQLRPSSHPTKPIIP